jgi:predicted transcriptional regulator
MDSEQTAIVRAAQAKNSLTAALSYAELGFSILPLKGKKPSLAAWSQHQVEPAIFDEIHAWNRAGLLENVGIVCGAVSNNLVVLDTDGPAGYPAFVAMFPHLAETFTVATGGGVGKHVYLFADVLPDTVRAMNTPIGHLELRANGCQVVAPPSAHPDTGQPYRVEKFLDILRVLDLADLVAWIEAFKPQPVTQHTEWRPPTNLPVSDKNLNPRVVQALAHYFHAQGFKQYGDWLHGSCIYPERHQHGDRNPSFGFHTGSGFGHCFVCGTILAKDICAQVGIDPADLGGLLDVPEYTPPTRPIRLSEAPPDEPDEMTNPADLKLPAWLEQYLDWAGTTGSQTPMIFHQAAGLWLLSVAIGRRLYGEAPWGVRIFPNMYAMLIASTTFYRKSTAFKLAEQVARQAIPHMLMPTPGSPERFQEALAGRLPGNFDQLTSTQKERLTKATPFAAQRGLLKDEVAGLFGAINRKEYMVGMKDLLMELYDCPDFSDKDTQSGLTSVENAALSILGVTTPAGLAAAVSDADWDNGLLIRFALLTPEPDYEERPPADVYQPVPQALVEGLRALHTKLPVPQATESGLSAPPALRLDVRCWPECQAYGDRLRRLCDPRRDTELDERLKGVYGRLHVHAFKLATLFAALDWLDTQDDVPVVNDDHWRNGEIIAESWRASAHRLLDQLDRTGEAIQERRQQDKLLRAIRQTGAGGANLRSLYRSLNLTAKKARQLAEDLARAGLVVERRNGKAEWYIAAEFADDPA